MAGMQGDVNGNVANMHFAEFGSATEQKNKETNSKCQTALRMRSREEHHHQTLGSCQTCVLLRMLSDCAVFWRPRQAAAPYDSLLLGAANHRAVEGYANGSEETVPNGEELVRGP